MGAFLNDDVANNSGTAYVFVRPETGWDDMTEDAKLSALEPAAGDNFGISVSISIDTVLVGAFARGNPGSPGAAYLFEEPGGGWVNMTETAKLIALDGASDDNFGSAVSIDTNIAVIGAQRDDDNGTNSGSAYVFFAECGGEDSDGDGVSDYVDNCPNSDLRESIIIDECDTGVGNQLFDDGCTMADRIAECAEGMATQGDFVSCVAQLANEWKQDGLISGREKGGIQSCTAQGNLWSQCQANADCDDGLFCNGVEVCLDGACVVGDPCPGQSCDEATDECMD